MARIVNGQVLVGVLADKLNLVDKDSDATCVRGNLAGRTAESWSMFLRADYQLGDSFCGFDHVAMRVGRKKRNWLHL